MAGEGSEPTIGVITALSKEYAAVRAMLDDAVDISRGGRSRRKYVTGGIPSSDGGLHRVALALLPTMGSNSATQRATLLLEHFPTVRHVVMVGIAGGAPNPAKPDEHVRLGDIVVSGSNGIVQYDYVSQTVDDVTHRNPPRPPSAALLEAVQVLDAGELAGHRPWLRHLPRAAGIRGSARPSIATDVLGATPGGEAVIPHPADAARRPDEPRVFVGTIGSANNLLRHPEYRDRMRDKFKIRAFEMEGSGIADATWAHDCGYLAIRGICDYCDAAKDDRWQAYAAVVAAAYLRALIECLPLASDRSGEASAGPDTTKFFDQAEALYRMMHYDVQRDREFGGRRVPLFLTGALGDATLHRVVDCLPLTATIGDLDRFVATLRQVRREVPAAMGTLVLGASLPPALASYAVAEGITLTTLEQLDAQLFDGRSYALQLRNKLQHDDHYRPAVYIEPLVTVGEGTERHPARELLEEWLGNPEWKQLTLLGDVGTGKTFLTHIFAQRLANAYLEAPLKHPLPLLVDLRHADREFSLEGLLATHFQHHGLPRMTFALFEHALAAGRIVLVLDGFDEMSTRVTPQVTARNFHELMKSVRGRAKVLLTCRTHYFLDRQNEQEVILGGPRGSSGDAAQLLYFDLISRAGFDVAYLCPFETSQIEDYVRQVRPRDSDAALSRIRKIYDLMELSRRPMLLEMIVRSLDRLEGDSINAAELYRVFTNVWIQRDERRDGPLSPERKHRLVTSLAFRLWTSGTDKMHHRELANHLAEQIGGADARTILEVDSEMRTASFLVRNPEGEYRFAHKSYAEFFVACHIAALLEQGDVRCLHVPPRIAKEHLAFVVDLVVAPEPVEQLLAGQLTETYVPNRSENALLCLAALRRARAQSPRALVELPASMRLEGAQLAGVRLSNLAMRSAVLTGARLSVSDLRHCDLSASDLRGADCSNALMSGAILDQALCVDANFTEADLQGVSVLDTDMTRADLSNAILTNTLLDDRHELLKHSIGIQRSDQTGSGPKSDELVSFAYERITHAVGEDSPDLDDLVQEVFLRLSMTSTGGQTEERETMRTRIFVLCSRILYDYYRRRTRSEEAHANILILAETTQDEAAAEGLRWEQLEDALEIELNALAPLSREIFLLRRQGVGFDEIAKLIDRSPSAVRKLHARTAAILKARLADLDQ